MRQRAVLFLAAVFPLYAEQGVLVARVKDIYRRAMPGLQLSAEGAAISAPTDAAGIARIPLPAQTQAGARVSLQLIKPPRDLTFISPWDEQIAVPRFDRAKEVPIMPADRGDRALPEDGPALASLTANVLKRIQPSPKNEPAGNAQRRHEAMIEVSRRRSNFPSYLTPNQH